MTFIAEAFFSGCISKVINDGKDYSWAKIKSVINDKNDRNLSTRIYRVIEKALIKVTDKKFKGTDILYEAIEKIFIEFRDHGTTIESVKRGLGMLNSDVTVERCENFLEKFYEGICHDGDLHKVIDLILQEKGIDVNQKEFQQLNKTVEYGFDQLNRKVDKVDEKISINNKNENLQNRKSVKSRTQEYADKWNANMFLNNFDKWDENAGVNVKLSDVYIDDHLPHFIWRQNNEKSEKLKEVLFDYICGYRGKRMLLILGQPGIGKSTLITWITANFADRKKDILVYQFASDLKNIDWINVSSEYDIADKMLKELNLSYDILANKVLIIDGFDEINTGNNIVEILDQLYWQLIKGSSVNSFSLIITCRANYIQKLNFSCAYITLQPWNSDQIQSFWRIYSEKTNCKISECMIKNILKKQEILGIPLILYMILALNISIEEEGSIVNIYDKIFSLNGGIYSRCIGYEEPHRIKKIEMQIHEISKRIAMWMFENNPEEASITQNEYRKICDNVMKEYKKDINNIEQDVKIGNFFKLVNHCEGVETEELYFVHRSIYEYFVAETIYISICEEIDISKERLASVFGKLFKKGKLSRNILDYLKEKIAKSRLKDFFDIVNQTFQLMLQDGMIAYTGECYKNTIICEMNVFANMLELIHLWDEGFGLRFDDLFSHYLKHNQCVGLNLEGIILKRGKDKSRIGILDLTKSVNISGVNLREANLRYANFEGANLSRADLRYAKLIEANFSKANFSGANLVGVDFGGANLEHANFERADLRDCLFQQFLIENEDTIKYSHEANLEKVNLTGAIVDSWQIRFLEVLCLDVTGIRVYIKESKKIMSYQEYCKNRIDND